MKETSKLILLWACTLGLAFFVGWQQGRTSSKSAESREDQLLVDSGKTNSAKPSTVSGGVVRQSVEFAKSNGEYDIPSIRYDKDTSNMYSLVKNMKSGDPVQRIRAFSEAVQNLDEDNLPQILEAFDTLPKGFQRYTELKMLMHSWAKMDPQGAMEYAKNLSRQEQRFGMMAALSSWATNDTNAALAWAEEDSGSAEKNPLMPAIVAGAAKADMGKATDLLFEMEYGHTRGQAVRMLITENLQAGGTRNLINWANSVPTGDDPKLVEGISSMVASQLADHDMEAAGDFVKSLEETRGRERAINSIVREMAEDSYVTAKDWLTTLPQKDQYAAMPEIVRKWAFEDATAAGEWLNGFPATEELDPSISTYVRSIRTKDPEMAKEWAMSIVNEDTRNNVIESLDNPQQERNGFFRSEGRKGSFRVRIE